MAGFRTLLNLTDYLLHCEISPFIYIKEYLMNILSTLKDVRYQFYDILIFTL
jgi:hypothetical protein